MTLNIYNLSIYLSISSRSISVFLSFVCLHSVYITVYLVINLYTLNPQIYVRYVERYDFLGAHLKIHTYFICTFLTVYVHFKYSQIKHHWIKTKLHFQTFPCAPLSHHTHKHTIHPHQYAVLPRVPIFFLGSFLW